MLLDGVKKNLGNFSLCIERFETPGPGIYGIIGPNGSGKSTLAKLMAGLLEPDNGSIDSLGLGSRDITYLQRKPYMMDDTVYNNLVYPLRVRGINPDMDIINEYLDKMRFSDRRKQKAKSLSGGEQQKLAFLRALIFKPRLIIVDEAMTALDIDSLDLFESIILKQQEKDPLIWIIISHQMPHIKRLVDRIFFMNQGRIETSGCVDEIFSGQTNPHLRQYLRLYGGGLSDNENMGMGK
jgi:ABC-type multidrug transport system ATPase subunit